jgi:hypothetical protein
MAASRWVKNKGTCDRKVVQRDLDKRGINLTNDKMTYMGNPHDKMVDLLFVTAQATLPGAITKEEASIFQYLLIASGHMNVRANVNVKLGIVREAKGSKGKHDPDNRNRAKGRKRRDFNTKREDQYVKAYRKQFRKADNEYYNGVHTSSSEVDGLSMGPFEAKYESMKIVCWSLQKWVPSTPVLLNLLITLGTCVTI